MLNSSLHFPGLSVSLTHPLPHFHWKPNVLQNHLRPKEQVRLYLQHCGIETENGPPLSSCVTSGKLLNLSELGSNLWKMRPMIPLPFRVDGTIQWWNLFTHGRHSIITNLLLSYFQTLLYPKLSQPFYSPWISVLGAGSTGNMLMFYIPGQQEANH